MRKKLALIVLILILGSPEYALKAQSSPDFFDPVALLLTWKSDPLTTMTIDWHVTETSRSPEIEYRIRSSGDDWSKEAEVETIDFPWSQRTIYRVELTGLQPGTEYDFRFGPGSKQYYFRTMPETLNQPLRIAVGGDTMHRQEWMEKTARQAMKYDPDFVMIGGDLAYADGLEPENQSHRDPQTPRAENQWYSWFEAYKKTLISDDYRVVPMVVAIGNHEVRGGYYFRHERRPDDPPYEDSDDGRQRLAPYFFSLFASPGLPGYNVLDFSDYLSVILLDTDHVNPVEGRQTDWLQNVLSERTGIPHVFPIYHVPAYPSVRDYMDDVMVKIRQNWVPLFEEYGIEMVFENHDHAYKRTHPIRNDEVASNGIVYVGDGAWGTETRVIGSRQDHDAWYIDKALSERHAIILTLHGTHRQMITVSSRGKVIDEFPAIYRVEE
jgi:acid phosphatase type 7